MVSVVPIQFGEWRPDQAPHMSPALVEATNVLPVAGAYAPCPAFVPIADTSIGTAATGLFSTPDLTGAPVVYGANRQKVYRIVNGGLREMFDAGTTLSVPWWFAQMNGRIIAGNSAIVPVAGEPGVTMTPLGGNPPTAAVGAVVERNFLVLGNITSDGIDGRQPRRVRWSGFTNPDTWGTSVGTQADYEDMIDEGGPVVAITGRSTSTVFQRRAITRMQYVGGSTVFNFTTVEQGRGAIATGAVCDIGPLVLFIADDGFFAWDGVQAVPIGTDRVDRWFNQIVDHTRLALISSAFDPVSRCVMWAFPERGQRTNSRIIVYSLADQKWTTIDFAAQRLVTSASFPMTLESMPTPDTASVSWDDASYGGRRPMLAGIGPNGAYGLFNGPALESTIVTGDFQSAPGKRSFVTGVRPLVDSDQVSVAVGRRDQLTSDVVAWNPATGQQVDGQCPQRIDGRYLRYRQTTAAGDRWTRSVGIEVALKAGGRR